MRILIATDAFPPGSGGSGWSTYELARGLRERGHDVRIVQPYFERMPPGYDGFAVTGVPAFAPSIPFVRNYFRNERLYPRLGAELADIARRHRVEVIHAQHLLTGPASVAAAERAGIPAVCTIRDYWPVCYWSDLLANPVSGERCPGCSAGAMTRCLRPRTGAAWPLTLPMIPYMRANLRRKQAALARADVIVAVSHSVERDLRERAPDLSRTRIETIPNAVDVSGMHADVAATHRPMAEPYALFVGKIARNKGAGSLVEVISRARLQMPLVVLGDGPHRAALEREAAAAGRDVRVLGWLDRRDVFGWLRHASFLIFPSTWPEPLSRVLLEGSALSVPIAAVNTGGTPDIIVDEETGLLSESAEELAADVARLAGDARLRDRLGAAARERAQAVFDSQVVIGRMERLYRDLVSARRRQQHARA